MLIQPLHIATRGRLDGEYGIATRGFIVLPDIVPRFPNRAEVDVVGWLPLPGAIEELEYTARVEEHERFTLVALAVDGPQMEARVEELAEPIAVLFADFDPVAVVEEIQGQVLGDVGEPGYTSELGTDQAVGVLDDGDSTGAVEESGLVGVTDEDEPPGC